MNKFNIIKTVLLLLIIGFVEIVFKAFEPTLSASIAIKQAQDTIDSSAQLSIYNSLKMYSPVFYLVLVALFYYKELKNIINPKKSEE